MKAKVIVVDLALFTGLIVANAANINIPDGNFENVNAVLKPPFVGVGTTTGNIGAWSAQYGDLVNVNGQMASSNAAAVDWIAPPAGCTNELQITVTAGAGASAGISQALTNCLRPNSAYTLTVDLNQQSTLNLIGISTLSLFAVNSTNLASVGGTNLDDVLNTSTNYQPVTLIYRTGNHVPTNTIGVSFTASSTASLGGTIYVDDFQLSVNPIQLQVYPSITPAHNGSAPTITLNGSGGAANATYIIMACTNIFAPSTAWVPVITNQFDANGNFSQPFTVNPNVPYFYYRTFLPSD